MIRTALRGLRGRLLLSFVATSAVTLLVAAAITLGPLQSRLRSESETALQQATEETRYDFGTALDKTANRKGDESEAGRQQRRATALGDIARDLRRVTMEDNPVRLTFSEFELLGCLMSRPGYAFNRQELLRAIWGDSAYRDPRAIDVHIRHLREKLEPRPEEPSLILTVPGQGYRFREA